MRGTNMLGMAAGSCEGAVQWAGEVCLSDLVLGNERECVTGDPHHGNVPGHGGRQSIGRDGRSMHGPAASAGALREQPGAVGMSVLPWSWRC